MAQVTQAVPGLFLILIAATRLATSRNLLPLVIEDIKTTRLPAIENPFKKRFNHEGHKVHKGRTI
jgi:hypothetical protein